eukprot:Nitzschia sp. Nitz4//scaffold21_size171442//80522//83295//NITZ4_002167-RA/size171442-processed-gene-0.161-mRNA-1//-1//CDS//3329542429//5940//frame0
MVEEERPRRFGSLLNKWQKLDIKGSETVQQHEPIQVKKKSAHAMQLARDLKEYRKSFTSKNYKGRTPTRGMSQYSKPAKLKNVFGADVDTSDFTVPVFDKSKEEKKVIKEAVKKNIFFNAMSRNERGVLIDAFEPIDVPKDGFIIQQGEVGDYFYVLADGKVAFSVDEVKVGEAEAGSSFGELALLHACPRAATVVAIDGPAKLFRVDQRTFRSVLRKQVMGMEVEKMKLLKTVHFLKDVDTIDLKRLASALKPRYYEVGDAVVKKGDQGDDVYIIDDGEFIVRNFSVGQNQFNDSTLKKGDCFGEQALVSDEPRKADVSAVTPGMAFSFDKATFEKVLGQFSRVVRKVQDRNILYQDGIELLALATVSHKQLEELSHLISDKNFQAGETIFDQSRSHEAALYLLRDGNVQLSGKRSDSIQPGGFFGEDMLLLDVRQVVSHGKQAQTMIKPSYTATATTDCQCGVLTLSDCRTVFDTTSMVDNAPASFVEEEGSAELKDEDTAPKATLKRDTTKQWLAKSSKTMLRNTVKANVALDDFERHSVLGEGQFGEVWLVSADLPGKYGLRHFALKAQKKDDPTRGDSIAVIRREIEVLGLMDHPFIVNLVHHYEDPEHLYILMGLVYGGELFDVIHTEQEDGTWQSGLPESDAKFYAMVIADTLNYIHRKQFAFRDLKPENVLIDTDGYPIICDFGFAKFVADKTYTLCGTPNYLSPEVITSVGHNQSSDHWALGVLIYEMVAGENPFYYDGMPQMELFECIVKEKYYPLPDEVSDQAFYVVDALLEKDPSQRLGSLAGRGKDILAKDWFSELNLDSLRQRVHKAPFVPSKPSNLEEHLDDDVEERDAPRSSFQVATLPALGTPPPVNLHGTFATLNTSSLLDDDDD